MTAARVSTPVAPAPIGSVRRAFNDGLVVAWRNLKRIPRIPELAIFAILQSIMFVLLFAFVFGGAILIPGNPNPNAYREYLMPGIFAQTIVFAAATTAIGMCDDINKGIIDRFRSLPMARSAVLTGRTSSDVVYNAGILVVLMVTGFAVGWTNHNGFGALLAGIALLLLFAFAMAWIGVWLGLSVPTVEVAQQVSFTVIFPITFVSSAFVPIASMPEWLQPFADMEPDQHAEFEPATPVGQPGDEPAERQPGVHGPGPRDAHLGRGHPGDLRPARRAPLSLDEPLNRRPPRAPTIVESCCQPPLSSPSVWSSD